MCCFDLTLLYHLGGFPSVVSVCLFVTFCPHFLKWSGGGAKLDVEKTPKCTHLKSWRSTLGHVRCGLVVMMMTKATWWGLCLKRWWQVQWELPESGRPHDSASHGDGRRWRGRRQAIANWEIQSSKDRNTNIKLRQNKTILPYEGRVDLNNIFACSGFLKNTNEYA